jgi:hypothetical protein
MGELFTWHFFHHVATNQWIVFHYPELHFNSSNSIEAKQVKLVFEDT